MQRVKIMDTCSDWTVINRGVPQGSVLGPLLFTIFLNDLFFLPLNNYLVNYADDNHICLENENLEVPQKHLQDDSNIAVKWFNNNQTTANPDKFQSIISSRHRIDEFDISLDGRVITRGNTLKMLGVTLDDKLNFNKHVRNKCQTASFHTPGNPIARSRQNTTNHPFSAHYSRSLVLGLILPFPAQSHAPFSVFFDGSPTCAACYKIQLQSWAPECGEIHQIESWGKSRNAHGLS